jgi:hypothetical protein
MPRFEGDPTKVSASLEVLPKDMYEFLIGEPKAFYRTNKAGNPSFGIRFQLTVAEGNAKGKKVLFSTYQQSEGAQAIGKQFVMAGLGYGKGRAEEARFDEDFRGKDWSFDTDTGACGDAWREVVGKRIVGNLEVRMQDDGNESQDFKSWLPLSAVNA